MVQSAMAAAEVMQQTQNDQYDGKAINLYAGHDEPDDIITKKSKHSKRISANDRYLLQQKMYRSGVYVKKSAQPRVHVA